MQSRGRVPVGVLHLINGFREGGTERQAVQLARLMHETGRFRVHVATLDRTGPLCSEVEALNLEPVAEYPLRSFYDLQMIRQVARCVRSIRQRRITVLHAHGFYSNIFGMAAGALARVPVRIASKRETAGCRSLWSSRAERVAFMLASVVVANCEAVRSQLISEGVRPAHVVTIHNSVDPRRVATRVRDREQALAMFGLPDTSRLRYIVLVANMDLHVKGHRTFLRAARRILEAVPDARFLIAGEGTLLPEMQRLAVSLGLQSDVFFLGRCDKIPELLLVSEVCVLSSASEGFPNAVLEYMAAGRPVVATDVGGTAEAITHGRNGFLVHPGNDASMADWVISMLRDPARARMIGQTARAEVLDRFAPSRLLERTLALYEAQLSRGKRCGEGASS